MDIHGHGSTSVFFTLCFMCMYIDIFLVCTDMDMKMCVHTHCVYTENKIIILRPFVAHHIELWRHFTGLALTIWGMGLLHFVGPLKSQVFFAKEPY